MTQPRFTAQAEADLVDAWRYFAKAGEARADAFLKQIHNQCLQLMQFPGMGRTRENLAPNLRSFPVKKYLIIYRRAGDTIEIVRVLHGARDIETIFQQEPPSQMDEGSS